MSYSKMSTKSIRLFPFLLKLKLSGDRTEKSSSSLFLMIELEEKYYSGAHLADDHCFRYYCGTTNQNVVACIMFRDFMSLKFGMGSVGMAHLFSTMS